MDFCSHQMKFVWQGTGWLYLTEFSTTTTTKPFLMESGKVGIFVPLSSCYTQYLGINATKMTLKVPHMLQKAADKVKEALSDIKFLLHICHMLIR